jgi:hypothetical protein
MMMKTVTASAVTLLCSPGLRAREERHAANRCRRGQFCSLTAVAGCDVLDTPAR